MKYELSPGNLLQKSEDPRAGAELFHTLLESPYVKLEHIISHGQASPPDFWYDQDEDEWVLLLRGEATLEFADGGMVRLTAGDHLTVPKRVRHRVHRTSEDAIWLALFLKV
ncbi:cupin 2 domain-containing protein [Roseimicrobium gellanilyticum]|uniref:Cupin 2 domain-containing protein n=1 Tax=Roseimicrobium gellanilyticum TaxID=748857 RepID=A0A366HH86_9BACT|nr:cupin domain-containing protein [Roseimicrobium gellanilyticum]RBP41195.1 cupin 2 domain-containing protein [Roseimicrobium gellanilyticum]